MVTWAKSRRTSWRERPVNLRKDSMGFLNGARVTFTRYRVDGAAPSSFWWRPIPPLPRGMRLAGTVNHPTHGVSTGRAGGYDGADLTFDLAKNVVNDALHLAIRIDTDKISGSLSSAYTEIETEALAPEQPERRCHQGSASGGEGGRPHQGRGRGRRRPGLRRAATITCSLGWPGRHPLRG